MAKTAKKQTEVAEFPRRAEIDAFTAEVRKDAEASLKFVEKVSVKTDAEREFASNALREVASRHKTYDEKRKSWVQPLKSVASDIDATFRPVLQALKRCEELLKERIGAFDVEQAQARAALLRQSAVAGASGDRVAAERAYAAAENYAAAEGGARSRIEWTGEVLDPTLIPREYLVPDEDKLRAVTKAKGGDPGIPGWRAFQTAAVRTSRKGVDE